jgi:multidrug resistance efflux pump
MDALPPIPTPASQRWREIRIRVLPAFFFLGVLAAVAFLWREVALPHNLAVGFVETNGALVSAPMDGLITDLKVKRFQQVKKNDPLCQYVIKDPKVLKAELDVIQASMEMIRITMTPVVDEERVRLAYYQLRLDVMKERNLHATETIQLRYATEEFRTAQNMLRDNAMATNTFERIRTTMDSLKASVEMRQKLIEDLDARLSKFTIAEPGHAGSPTPIQAAIAVEAARIKQLEAAATPIQLIAPMDGMVTVVNRHSGEYLRVGDPILTISATESEQIIAYVRQPINIPPEVGMTVQVRSRTPKRETASATVTRVGAQMEPFSMAMIPNAPNQRLQEFGLPIQVTLPPALKLVPGELVDLILESKKK